MANSRSSISDLADIPGLSPLDGDLGPALPLADADARRLVAGLLTQHRRPSPMARVLRFPKAGLVGISVVVAASAAAAAAGDALPRWLESITEPRQAPVAAVTSAGLEAKSKRRDPLPAHATLAEPIATDSVPGVSPAASALEAPVVPERRRVAQRPSPPAPPETRTVLAATPLPSNPDAVDRLGQANELRRQQRYGDALERYLEVVERYPGTLEAQAARVSAATLRLEHFSDSAGAERLFRQASQGGGELSAEAEFGIAESLRAAGDTVRERAALERFLERHPDSPLARAARERRSSLPPP